MKISDMNLQNSLEQVVYIDSMHGNPLCATAEDCLWYKNQMEEKLVGKYIAHGQPFEKQIVAACLPVSELNYHEYIQKIKKQYKGASIRQSKKADREGFVCKPFNYALFVPDIVEINHSKEQRCGRPMTEPYKRSVEELGGEPTAKYSFVQPKCSIHYDLWWGIFQYRHGYKQGMIVTDEKLLGYIRLRRNGNYALYAQILGHGDFLKFGIIYRLHLAIMEWISCGGDGLTSELALLIYAGFYSGQHGLQIWKKKLLFSPAFLVINH
jgi:hypothetical protein